MLTILAVAMKYKAKFGQVARLGNLWGEGCGAVGEGDGDLAENGRWSHHCPRLAVGQRQRLQGVAVKLGDDDVVDTGGRARQHRHFAAVPAPFAGLPLDGGGQVFIEAGAMGFFVAPQKAVGIGQPNVGLVLGGGGRNGRPRQVNVKSASAGDAVLAEVVAIEPQFGGL